jgi:hypothetical protein
VSKINARVRGQFVCHREYFKRRTGGCRNAVGHASGLCPTTDKTTEAESSLVYNLFCVLDRQLQSSIMPLAFPNLPEEVKEYKQFLRRARRWSNEWPKLPQWRRQKRTDLFAV